MTTLLADRIEMTILFMGFLPANPANGVNGTSPPVEMTTLFRGFLTGLTMPIGRQGRIRNDTGGKRNMDYGGWIMEYGIWRMEYGES